MYLNRDKKRSKSENLKSITDSSAISKLTKIENKGGIHKDKAENKFNTLQKRSIDFKSQYNPWEIIQCVEQEEIDNDSAHGGGDEPDYPDQQFGEAFGHWGGKVDADVVYANSDPVLLYSKNRSVTQLEFDGPATSGPKDYDTSGGEDLKQIAYDRDGDGAITFAAPSLGPTSGDASKNIDTTSYIDLQDVANGGIPSGSIKNNDRRQHFSVADNMLGLRRKTTRGAITALRKGRWTWHHLKTEHQMVLVDMKVHKKHGHNGGVHLWK